LRAQRHRRRRHLPLLLRGKRPLHHQQPTRTISPRRHFDRMVRIRRSKPRRVMQREASTNRLRRDILVTPRSTTSIMGIHLPGHSNSRHLPLRRRQLAMPKEEPTPADILLRMHSTASSIILDSIRTGLRRARRGKRRRRRHLLPMDHLNDQMAKLARRQQKEQAARPAQRKEAMRYPRRRRRRRKIRLTGTLSWPAPTKMGNRGSRLSAVSLHRSLH